MFVHTIPWAQFIGVGAMTLLLVGWIWRVRYKINKEEKLKDLQRQNPSAKEEQAAAPDFTFIQSGNYEE